MSTDHHGGAGRPTRSLVDSMVRSGGARILVLAVSLLCTTLTSRLIFQETGPRTFGLAALIATTSQLIPFADLGTGAVVMNRVAAARSRGAPHEALRTVRHVVRLLRRVVVVAVVVLVLAAAVLVADGRDAVTSVMVVAAVSLVLLNVPLGVGNRVLIGLDRTHVATLLALPGPPCALALALVLSRHDVPASAFVLAWPLGTVVGSALAYRAGSRALVRNPAGVRGADCPAPTRAEEPVEAIWRTSLPMLVISVATPLALASDRWVITLVTGLEDAAVYSVAAQIYAPLLSVLTTAATPLWSHFAVQSHDRRTLARAMGFLGTFGLASGVALVAATPVYAHVVTSTTDYVPLDATVAFAVLLLLHGLVLPHMMRLNSGRRLVAQAVLAVVSASANVGLSFALTPALGVSGPVIASCGCLLVLQLAPMTWINFRAHRAGR